MVKKLQLFYFPKVQESVLQTPETNKYWSGMQQLSNGICRNNSPCTQWWKGTNVTFLSSVWGH